MDQCIPQRHFGAEDVHSVSLSQLLFLLRWSDVGSVTYGRGPNGRTVFDKADKKMLCPLDLLGQAFFLFFSSIREMHVCVCVILQTNHVEVHDAANAIFIYISTSIDSL